jgi:hypothetical protein
MTLQTGFVWFKIDAGTNADFFNWLNKPLGSIRSGQFPDLLSDYQFLKRRV